ncbi:unnamed protein product [Peniophora sp. CBMAI 1063]|nr:unnamed protein product [Peniophora sp. CBMAI 1063]
MSLSPSPISVSDDEETSVFNAADADIRLRSSDGVVFAVHRLLLRWISPFFADMLSLPQPTDGDADKPMIEMSEDATSLRLLLCFSYPRTQCPEPSLTTVTDIRRAATLARKFDCGPLVRAVGHAIVQLAQKHPEAAYALAWKFELRIALRASARASVCRTWFIEDGRVVPEFNDLPAQSIILLGRYRSAFYDAVLRELSIDELHPHPDWIAKADVESARELRPIEPHSEHPGPCVCKICSCEKFMMGFRFSRNPEAFLFNQLLPYDTPRWWLNFVANVLASIKASSIDAAILKAARTARKEVRACPRCCPLLDFDDALITTGVLLKEAIERQLDKTPLHPPF